MIAVIKIIIRNVVILSPLTAVIYNSQEAIPPPPPFLPLYCPPPHHTPHSLTHTPPSLTLPPSTLPPSFLISHSYYPSLIVHPHFSSTPALVIFTLLFTDTPSRLHTPAAVDSRPRLTLFSPATSTY